MYSSPRSGRTPSGHSAISRQILSYYRILTVALQAHNPTAPHYIGGTPIPCVPRAPVLQEYFNDEVHVEGLGLAAAIGWAYKTDGGVNMSFNLSAMWAGDLAAYGLTFGWNMPE